MNLNVYLNNQLYQELEEYRKSVNKNRNSVITEAVIEWINKHKKVAWSKDIFKFDDEVKGVYPDSPELREGLIEPKVLNF